MEGFQVTEIGEKIYCILDAGNSSFYVVEGEEKAAVIDTGITAGAKILPVIRELTDKPLLLVITHAHPDHMYHIDEFNVGIQADSHFECLVMIRTAFADEQILHLFLRIFLYNFL